MNTNYRKCLIILTILFLTNSYSQREIKVKFNIFFKKNNPASGVNITVKNSKPLIETQTDLNGNAELSKVKEKDIIQINYMGPSAPKFTLLKSSDSIAINLEKRIVILF